MTDNIDHSVRHATPDEEREIRKAVAAFLKAAAAKDGTPNLETDPTRRDAAAFGQKFFTAASALVNEAAITARSNLAIHQAFVRIAEAIGIVIGVQEEEVSEWLTNSVLRGLQGGLDTAKALELQQAVN